MRCRFARFHVRDRFGRRAIRSAPRAQAAARTWQSRRASRRAPNLPACCSRSTCPALRCPPLAKGCHRRRRLRSWSSTTSRQCALPLLSAVSCTFLAVLPANRTDRSLTCVLLAAVLRVSLRARTCGCTTSTSTTTRCVLFLNSAGRRTENSLLVRLGRDELTSGSRVCACTGRTRRARTASRCGGSA